ncbi:sensor histidine kinase [Oceanomicrobium pacificus]|uniref:histidine kinase n=1 Tax=Oceanomicrobium pacificus TaxID=2692916 RepID=A0A6B0TQD4_9RHOB|nr:ATP-binding protein [Oceanomicrobium pacificus]MXU66867.1 PAS domain-containing protein [Oceanomicrobium pacificus]
MTARYWAFALAAFCAATVAAALTALGAPAAIVFLLVLAMFVLAGLVLEVVLYRTEPEEAPEEPPATLNEALPAGFGRAMLEQMPTPILVISGRGRITYANPAATATLPRVRLDGHFSELFRAPAFVEAVTETARDGQPRDVEFTVYQDREMYFEARAVALPDGGDLGTGQVLVQIEDRTKAHRAEAQRRDFLANASHELRTPLASVLGYVETLMGHAKDDPDAQERFLAIIYRQGQRMQRLVEDLMSLNRIEMNEHIRPDTLCDPVQIGREVCAALAPLAEDTGASLHCDLPAEGTILIGDQGQIYQVMTNLVSNALRYGGAGAMVRVHLAEADPSFPNMLGITVSDTGPGIPRDQLHRLTERFFRVSATQNRDKGGTGLGLAIVKHILARHRGELRITSIPGEGSDFTVWLPRDDSVAKPGDSALAARKPA